MDADAAEPASSSAESKRKFLEAIERKKQAASNGTGAGGPDGGTRGGQGVRGRAGGIREFRRKSG